MNKLAKFIFLYLMFFCTVLAAHEPRDLIILASGPAGLTAAGMGAIAALDALHFLEEKKH